MLGTVIKLLKPMKEITQMLKAIDKHVSFCVTILKTSTVLFNKFIDQYSTCK